MKSISLYKKLALFPALIIYLELVLHIFMGMSLKYLPIYFFFSIAYGALLTALTGLFGNKKYTLVTKIIVFIVSFIYGAEYFAKTILQSFYPVSVLGTAANNKLDQFIWVILGTLVKKFYMIILFLIPFILCMLFLKKKTRKTKEGGRADRKRLKSSAVIILSLALAIICFIIGLLTLLFPSKNDITPRMLYNSDTYFDDQVEQLGLMNMLRLDIKHMIIPAKGLENGDPELPDIEEPEPEPEIVYNVMNFDFEAMQEAAKTKDEQWLSKYFAANSYTAQNQYTGSMKDYNVIVMCLEGFSGYAISEEYTPTLYKLTHEGFVFNNFYTALHYTSTSNGECQVLLSLYPKAGNPITMQRTGELKTNNYFSLAPQLARLGYTNIGFHNNQYNLYGRQASHENLGYDWYGGHMLKKSAFFLELLPNRKEGSTNPKDYRWPQKDSYMIANTTPIYENLETPFNVYYMTISGHIPAQTYGWNYPTLEFKESLKDAPYSEGTKAYIATCMDVDKAVATLIENLRAAGKLDNTLLVAVPDHIPYGCVDVLEELSGKKFGTSEALTAINEKEINFDVYKSSLIMWNSKMAEAPLNEDGTEGEKPEPVIIDKVCCQVDVLPTISNLLGLEYDSRMLAGSDILSDSEGLVVFSSRSWKSDRGFYNRFTQKFTPAEGVVMTEEEQTAYVDQMKTIVANKLDMTSKVVESNFYNFAIQYLKAPEETGAND
ncbi:MAG: sulfatase-like hydrolase/transferase [Clostridia bacterium]|nr:sulfatase-like hydrolase/transferase [Clostridia bacterium]